MSARAFSKRLAVIFREASVRLYGWLLVLFPVVLSFVPMAPVSFNRLAISNADRAYSFLSISSTSSLRPDFLLCRLINILQHACDMGDVIFVNY
jgi:hypothetical protein